MVCLTSTVHLSEREVTFSYLCTDIDFIGLPETCRRKRIFKSIKIKKLFMFEVS